MKKHVSGIGLGLAIPVQKRCTGIALGFVACFHVALGVLPA
jgi:hypothetical protein